MVFVHRMVLVLTTTGRGMTGREVSVTRSSRVLLDLFIFFFYFRRIYHWEREREENYSIDVWRIRFCRTTTTLSVNTNYCKRLSTLSVNLLPCMYTRVRLHANLHNHRCNCTVRVAAGCRLCRPYMHLNNIRASIISHASGEGYAYNDYSLLELRKKKK